MTWRWYALPVAPGETGPVAASKEGPGPIRGGSAKHMRMDYDPTSGRVILTGGDRAGIGDGNGQPSVWASVDGQKWTTLSPPCISDTAQIYPARPDTVIWAIDGKRNRGVIMPGFYFGVAKAQSDCHGASLLHTALLFNLTTNRWEAVPWPAPHPNGQYGGDENSSWGIIDPVGDSLYRYFWNGNWGATLEKLDLAANTWTIRQLGEKTASQAYDDAIRNAYATRAQPALDIRGRSLYFSTLDNRLFRVRLDVPDHRGEWVGKAAPAACVPPGDASQEVYLVFDEAHRAILRMCTPNAAGEVLGVAAYFIDQAQWAWYAAPTDQPHAVLANAFTYSPRCRRVIAIGGHLIRSATTGQMLPNPLVSWTLSLQ